MNPERERKVRMPLHVQMFHDKEPDEFGKMAKDYLAAMDAMSDEGVEVLAKRTKNHVVNLASRVGQPRPDSFGELMEFCGMVVDATFAWALTNGYIELTDKLLASDEVQKERAEERERMRREFEEQRGSAHNLKRSLVDAPADRSGRGYL